MKPKKIVPHSRNLSHIEKQFIKFSNYWLNESDKDKKAVLLKNMLKMSEIVAKAKERQRGEE